jgi:hypothetical protein
LKTRNDRRGIPALLAVAAVAVLATAGCGERREDTGTVAAPTAVKAAGSGGVSANSALACMKGKGLHATRRPGAGERLRVAYAGGSVLVYVYPSKSVATRKRETLAVASKTSGGGVEQQGNAVTVAGSGTPAAVLSKIRGCLRS